MIRGITFDKQLFKSKDFALMTKRFFNNTDGIIEGCELTYNAGNVLLAIGYFVSSGYYVNISSQETIVAQTGKLIFEIDLSKINTETTYLQGSFKFITGDLTQEDLFNGGEIYQLHFADVVVNGGVVTSLTTIISDIAKDFQTQIDALQNRIKSGTIAPESADLTDGDIYLQYE